MMIATDPTIDCHECGAPVSPSSDDAYDTLYGPYRLDPSGLEREIRGALLRAPERPAADVLAEAFEGWVDFDPLAFVAAVQHRLIEEAQ